MANQRHPDQRLVAFALPAELLSQLESARKAAGQDRSAYIRAALLEKLKAMNVPVADSLKDAPDRTGKTYRPRKISSYRKDQKRGIEKEEESRK